MTTPETLDAQFNQADDQSTTEVAPKARKNLKEMITARDTVALTDALNASPSATIQLKNLTSLFKAMSIEFGIQQGSFQDRAMRDVYNTLLGKQRSSRYGEAARLSHNEIAEIMAIISVSKFVR